MALSIAFLPIYTKYMTELGFEGPMAMLGNQAARFSEVELTRVLRRFAVSLPGHETGHKSLKTRLTMEQYMSNFGVNEYIDIDLYGTPKLRLDLNCPLPSEYKGFFRTVADIGTLEHVMNPFQALENVREMLPVGGRVFHMSPAKVRLNHGYYTISPQLLFDFYLANGFKVLRSDLVSHCGSYDSRLCFVLATNYSKDGWVLHEPGRGLPYWKRIARYLRRVVADYAVGTQILFAAEKVMDERTFRSTVQNQWTSS